MVSGWSGAPAGKKSLSLPFHAAGTAEGSLPSRSAALYNESRCGRWENVAPLPLVPGPWPLNSPVPQKNLFPEEPASPPILSVYELTVQIKDLLENSFPAVWVSGEISNLSRPQSGHCYLTLKDERAQIRAAMWRNVAARVEFELADGLEVICRGHLDVYAPRGSYQLIIEQIEPKGIGALELALRQLREKLAREGLFDPGRKRPLPRLVRRVAIGHQSHGGGHPRFPPGAGPSLARGRRAGRCPPGCKATGAAEEIAAAIATANRLPLAIDCLVVARGGGSLEDLWAFNEEAVVRAIFASRIPVISAIGHEIDVTLSDLVADVRALTPSEAAELVAPAAEELLARLRQLENRARRGHALSAGVGAGAAGDDRPASRLSPSSAADRRPVAASGRVGSGGRPRHAQPAGACRAAARSGRGAAGIAQPAGRPGPGLQPDAADGRRPSGSATRPSWPSASRSPRALPAAKRSAVSRRQILNASLWESGRRRERTGVSGNLTARPLCAKTQGRKGKGDSR